MPLLDPDHIGCPKHTQFGYSVFTGSAAKAADMGFVQDARRTRPASEAGGPWQGDVEITWRDASDRVANAGDVYRIAVDEEGHALEGAVFEFWCKSTAMNGLVLKVNPARVGGTTQNGLMRNAAGIVLYDEAGDPITAPVVGEQARNEWTGEPLVDEKGNPVLVTA